MNDAIEVLNSRVVQDGAWAKHGSGVEVEFIVDEQGQIQVTGFGRDSNNGVIHTLKFTLRAA